MTAFLTGGCSASAESQQDDVVISMQYASVVSISGTSMTIQPGTLKKSTKSNEGNSGSDSASAMDFIPEGDVKNVTISSDITILKDDYTVEASEIETGDILLINYSDSIPCALEVISSPDTVLPDTSE